MAGRLDGALNFAGGGGSEAALIGSLAGEGALSLRDFSMAQAASGASAAVLRASAFDEQDFDAQKPARTLDLAFAAGHFRHRVRATGKPFESAWALRARLKAGRIVHYRFYEDTERLAIASAS